MAKKITDKKAADAARKRKKYAENPELARHQRIMKRSKHLQNELAKETARNREKGHKPRPVGAKAVASLIVPPSRKWHLFEGRVYFTALKGFTAEEVQAILAAIKHHPETPTKTTPKAAKKATRKHAR